MWREVDPGVWSDFYVYNPELNFEAGSWPIDGGNTNAALGDGLHSWNIYRTSSGCTKPSTPLNGRWFNQYYFPSGANPLNVADGANVVGFYNWESPPPGYNFGCAQEVYAARASGLGHACTHTPRPPGWISGRLEEWGISINTRPNGNWISTNLARPQPWFLLQSIMTHEGGHVLGLAHSIAPYCHGNNPDRWDSRDDHAALTMYPCPNTVTTEGNLWPYTLARGDMLGAEDRTP